MADETVEWLLSNLKQLVLYHSQLISGARSKSELMKLTDELVKLNYFFLKEARTKYKRDGIYKQWDREIREVVYDIEDTIDTYVTHMAAEAARRKNSFKWFMSRPTKFSKMVENIRRNKVKPLLWDIGLSSKLLTAEETTDTTVAEARESRQKKTRNIVGFETEIEEFIDFLTSESSKLEIASVVGMAGIGKTTLTWKIFEHERINYEFPLRIWVNISEDFNVKNVLLSIHRNLFAYHEERSPQSIEELIKDIRHCLSREKFLIIMDDIWTTCAWNTVKEIFSKDNCMGRVLLTTRHRDVAEYASTRMPHYLRILTVVESWQLLQYKVFGDLNVVPIELEGVGHDIAKDCDGLPLSIVVMGGMLVEKKSRGGSNISAIKKEWEKISKNVKYYLIDGNKNKLLLSILSLSYENVSDELRNCFLYLGVFPKEADIPVKELVRLWIAEGFILESNGRSLEEHALFNLNELINRSLVMVKETKLNGEPKICHIHNLVHEICNTEAKYENLNLFQEITRSQRGFEPRNNIEKFRRLCVHSYALDFLKTTTKVSSARSFLCFDQSSIMLERIDMARVSDILGLLRVYDAKNIICTEFPQMFVRLVHLRYLTLVVTHCTCLPEAISELWNLQTLNVDVSSKKLDIKADIGTMRQLRHLNTKSSITLKKDGRGEECNNLQTLNRLCPESCTDTVFRKMKNLITLGIQGELNKLVNSECLQQLGCLHKLKLVNEVPGVAAEYPFQGLPKFNCFPPNLKVLVLSATYLNWTEISVFSMLGSLEVLKLKNNAFRGNSWEVVSSFDHLKHLHIERSSELVYWKANGKFFPRLRIVLLNNCEKLIEIPSAVCENVEKLCMECVTKELVCSAEVIAEEKNKQGVAFKLDIIPDDKMQKA